MTTNDITTAINPIDIDMFDVYTFGSRSAATAALTCAMIGGNVDGKVEAMRAAFQGTMSPRRVAGRVAAAAKRADLPAISPTILARRMLELLKGEHYGTMPYGDGDRTIVFVRRDSALPLARTLKKNADARMQAARPALKAAADLAPKKLAA